MQDNEVINILRNQLSFSSKSISDLKIFKNELLKANKKHNFISKNTETVIWHRHHNREANQHYFLQNATSGHLQLLPLSQGNKYQLFE